MSMPPLASSGSSWSVSQDRNGAAPATRTRKPVKVCSTKSSVVFMRFPCEGDSANAPSASEAERVGVFEHAPGVLEAQEAERLFVTVPGAGAVLLPAGFRLVPHQEEDDPHGLPVDGIFALARARDHLGAHGRLLLDLPYRSLFGGLAV